jgi:chromosome segregation ATPase
MASKLRTYAEEELGVHKVHEEAENANGHLVDLNLKLADVRSARREWTEQIADREAVILKQIRDTHTDLSATAHEQKARLERRSDRQLHDMRVSLMNCQKEEDRLEGDIKHTQNKISIATARMIQLGGYLPFLYEIMKSEAVAPNNTP